MMSKLLKPHFERQLIEDECSNSHWIEAFNTTGNSSLDIVGYGFGVDDKCAYIATGNDKELYLRSMTTQILLKALGIL